MKSKQPKHSSNYLCSPKTSIGQKHGYKSISKLLKDPKLIVSLFLVGLTVAIFTTPLKQVFNQMALVEYLQANKCCVVVPFILVYTALTIVGIPGTLLTVAGGIVFGIWWGTLWSVIGATLGALGAFITARYLLRDFIAKKFKNSKILAKCNRAITKQPITFVLTIRFAPISPFNVVNFLFGLTPIHWFSYTVATFFGIIPGTLAYTWLGTSGVAALEGQNNWSFFLALSFLTLLSIVPFLFKKKSKN